MKMCVNGCCFATTTIISEISNVLLKNSLAHSSLASPHYYLASFEYFLTTHSLLMCSSWPEYFSCFLLSVLWASHPYPSLATAACSAHSKYTKKDFYAHNMNKPYILSIVLCFLKVTTKKILYLFILPINFKAQWGLTMASLQTLLFPLNLITR